MEIIGRRRGRSPDSVQAVSWVPSFLAGKRHRLMCCRCPCPAKPIPATTHTRHRLLANSVPSSSHGRAELGLAVIPRSPQFSLVVISRSPRLGLALIPRIPQSVGRRWGHGGEILMDHGLSRPPRRAARARALAPRRRCSGGGPALLLGLWTNSPHRRARPPIRARQGHRLRALSSFAPRGPGSHRDRAPLRARPYGPYDRPRRVGSFGARSL